MALAERIEPWAAMASLLGLEALAALEAVQAQVQVVGPGRLEALATAGETSKHSLYLSRMHGKVACSSWRAVTPPVLCQLVLKLSIFERFILVCQDASQLKNGPN